MKTKIFFLSLMVLLIFSGVLLFANSAKAQICMNEGDLCGSSNFNGTSCCSGLTCVDDIPGLFTCITQTGGGGNQGNCPTGFTEKAGVCFPTETGLPETSIVNILSNFLSWILGIFGFIAIIAFVISGIQYLTAAGSEKTLETAKRNMKWSIVGVIVGISGLVIIWAITEALKATTPYF